MPRTSAAKSRVVRPLRGGQITIPSEFRKKLGIDEDSLIRVTLEDDELRLKKVQVKETSKGSPWLKELYGLFAPVREDLAAFTEDEIDAAIDQAVTEVRRTQRG